MAVITNDVAEILTGFTNRIKEINERSDKAAMDLRITYRMQMEPLFVARQAALQNVDNFWSTVLASPETPLAPLMNSTIDPKITRAIIDYQVTTTEKDGHLLRKVIIKLRTNIMTEEGEIFREIDSAMKTTSMSELRWKAGTERARKDSLFSFFTATPFDREGFLTDALEGFDTVFQNPFLSVISD